MLTYPWKCTVLHCNHLGNTWKPLVLMTRHFDYCPSASEGDNQSVRSSAPVVSRCFPGGYNVKLYISRGRLAWWLLAFLHREYSTKNTQRSQKLIYLHLPTDCFMKVSLQSTGPKNTVFLCKENSAVEFHYKKNKLIHSNATINFYFSLFFWRES